MIEDAQVIRLCLRLGEATGPARGFEGRKRRKRKGTMISYPVIGPAQETRGPGTIPFRRSGCASQPAGTELFLKFKPARGPQRGLGSA